MVPWTARDESPLVSRSGAIMLMRPWRAISSSAAARGCSGISNCLSSAANAGLASATSTGPSHADFTHHPIGQGYLAATQNLTLPWHRAVCRFPSRGASSSPQLRAANLILARLPGRAPDYRMFGRLSSVIVPSASRVCTKGRVSVRLLRKSGIAPTSKEVVTLIWLACASAMRTGVSL